jgi:hypothetical protein
MAFCTPNNEIGRVVHGRESGSLQWLPITIFSTELLFPRDAQD